MKRFNITLAILGIFSTGYAQTLEQKNYTVHINYPAYSVKVVVLNDERKITTKEDLTYYWYAHNEIKETKGGYDGRLLDGEYTALYLNNNLKEKGNFRKGLKDGKWTSWYENGSIREITTWKNGLKNGKHYDFDLNGNKLIESNYSGDQLDGISMNYENGKVVTQKQYKDGVEVPVVEKAQDQSSETAKVDKTNRKSWKFWKKKKDKAQDS